MKVSTWLAVISLFFCPLVSASGTQYDLRIDGLACPFCAYGIEKKLIKTEGVTSVTFDLVKGLVIVTVQEGIILTELQLKQWVHDAGFTLRSVSEKPY